LRLSSGLCPLLDNIHAAIREHNVAMRISEAIRNRKGVHHACLVVPIRQFSIHVHKVDAVFHTGHLHPTNYTKRVFDGQPDFHVPDSKSGSRKAVMVRPLARHEF